MKLYFTILHICIFSVSLAFNQKYIFEQYELNFLPDSTFTFHESSAMTYDIVSGKYLFRNDSIILTTHQYDNEEAIFSIVTHENDITINIEYVQKEYVQSFPRQLYLTTTYYKNGNPEIERFFIGEIAKGNFQEYHWNEDRTPKSHYIFQKWGKIEEQIYFSNKLFSIFYPKEIKTWKNGLAHGEWFYYTYTEDRTSVKLVMTEIYKKGKLKKEKW